MYMYKYIYIYIYIYVCVCIHTYIRVCVHNCAYTNICMHVCKYIYIYIYTYIYTCVAPFGNWCKMFPNVKQAHLDMMIIYWTYSEYVQETIKVAEQEVRCRDQEGTDTNHSRRLLRPNKTRRNQQYPYQHPVVRDREGVEILIGDNVHFFRRVLYSWRRSIVYKILSKGARVTAWDNQYRPISRALQNLQVIQSWVQKLKKPQLHPQNLQICNLR